MPVMAAPHLAAPPSGALPFSWNPDSRPPFAEALLDARRLGPGMLGARLAAATFSVAGVMQLITVPHAPGHNVNAFGTAGRSRRRLRWKWWHGSGSAGKIPVEPLVRQRAIWPRGASTPRGFLFEMTLERSYGFLAALSSSAATPDTSGANGAVAGNSVRSVGAAASDSAASS